MTRMLRIILVVACALVLLVVVALLFVSVNQFRGPIEDRASAALGRSVELGDLNFSLFPGSIIVSRVTIADDPAFGRAPFVTAASARVGVELWPLIASRTLRITGITIEHPHVTLLRNPSGQWNYASLTATFEEYSPAGIATLVLTDGRLAIGSTTTAQHTVYDHVNVKASRVTLADRFPVTATAALPGVGSFRMDGDVGPVNRHDAPLTPFSANVAFDRWNLAAAVGLEPSAGIGGLVDVAGGITSRDGAVESHGTATFVNALLVAGGSPATQPATVQFAATYDIRRHAGVLNRSVLKIGGAEVALSGTYRAGTERAIFNGAVAGEELPLHDIEPFLPAFGVHLPKGGHLTGGRMAAHLAVAGPTNQLVTTGEVRFSKATLSGFDLGASLQAIAAFSGVRTGTDIRIDSLSTTVRIAPSGVRLDRFDATLPQVGRVVGAGTIDAANRLDFKMVATLAGPLSVGSLAPVGTAGALEDLLGAAIGVAPRNQPRVRRIPFLVQGTASNPEFVPDVGGIVMDALEQEVKRVLAAPVVPPAGRQQPAPFLPFDPLLTKKPR